MTNTPFPVSFSSDEMPSLVIGTLIGLIHEVYGRLYVEAAGATGQLDRSEAYRVMRMSVAEATRFFDPTVKVRIEAKLDEIAAMLMGMEVVEP